jgi:hypothetical protein
MAKTQGTQSDQTSQAATSNQAENQPNTQAKIESALEVSDTKAETLPELCGRMTENILTALQGTDAKVKQDAIAASKRDMRIWYDAQPVEGRKEAARSNRKTLENFKLVAESFFQEMMTISAQDAL